MKIRFLLDVDGVIFILWKNWNHPFLPSVGHAIDLISFMTEEEKNKAKSTEVIYSDSQGVSIESILLGFLTDPYSQKVIFVAWDKDYVEIQIHRTEKVEIIKLGDDNLTDDSFFQNIVNLDILNEGIDTSNISSRTVNILSENKISTYKDILSLLLKEGRKGLTKMRGIGRKGVSEIENILIKKKLIEDPFKCSDETKGLNFYTSKYKDDFL